MNGRECPLNVYVNSNNVYFRKRAVRLSRIDPWHFIVH